MNHPLMPALAEIKLLQDRLNEKIARIEQLEARLDRAVTRGLDQVERIATLEAALTNTAAHLAAAISLLERTPKANQAAPSNKMFDIMLSDYRKALTEARAALAPEQEK